MFKKIIVLGMALIMCLAIFTGCNQEEKKVGAFYTLKEAYDEGWLLIDDLRSIAYYQSGVQDEPNFVPIPKNPENLSGESEIAIKKTYLANLLAQTNSSGKKLYPRAKMDDINILGYYGTYNDLIAVKISDEYSGFADVVVELTIAGVTFTYSGACVVIWKSNQT